MGNNRHNGFQWILILCVALAASALMARCTTVGGDSDSKENIEFSFSFEKEEIAMPPLVNGWPYKSAVDSQGRLHLAGYVEQDFASEEIFDLGYTRWTGETWEIDWLTSDEDFGGIVLALDSQDRPHVAYVRDYESYPDTAVIQYARKTNGAWQDTEVLFHSGSITLALDDNDVAHLAAILPEPPGEENRLVFIENQGGTWPVEDVDRVKDSTQFLHMAIRNGQVHLLYVHTDRDHHDDDHTDNNEVRYAVGQKGQWSVTTIDGGEDNGRWPHIHVNPLGGVHGIYCYDDSEDVSLMHALNTGSGWTTGSFDQGEITYLMSTMDAKGIVHGAYAKRMDISVGQTSNVLYYGNTMSGSMESDLADDTPGTRVQGIGSDSTGRVHLYFITGTSYHDNIMWHGMIDVP